MLFEEELGEAGAADAEAWERLEGVGRSLVNLLPMFGVGGIVGKAVGWGRLYEGARKTAGTGELLLALAVERKELSAAAEELLAAMDRDWGITGTDIRRFLQRVQDGRK